MSTRKVNIVTKNSNGVNSFEHYLYKNKIDDGLEGYNSKILFDLKTNSVKSSLELWLGEHFITTVNLYNHNDNIEKRCTLNLDFMYDNKELIINKDLKKWTLNKSFRTMTFKDISFLNTMLLSTDFLSTIEIDSIETDDRFCIDIKFIFTKEGMDTKNIHIEKRIEAILRYYRFKFNPTREVVK